jgi:hypothetical protein
MELNYKSRSIIALRDTCGIKIIILELHASCDSQLSLLLSVLSPALHQQLNDFNLAKQLHQVNDSGSHG